MSTNPHTKSGGNFSIFDDDEDGWQDMPVIRKDDFADGLDEEDQKKYKYITPEKSGRGTNNNATGNLIDFDDRGNEWRSKLDQNEDEYTRLRLDEEDDADDVHLRTKYLFDEDKAMTPLSQMQATKNLLTEAQRIAYVALCALALREMTDKLKNARAKELKASITSQELWSLKIMGRLYYHMELATQEQKMIESLAEHGVQAIDLVPSLMTTHTVANPEYDPVEAKKLEENRSRNNEPNENDGEEVEVTIDAPEASPQSSTTPMTAQKTTANVLQPSSTTAMPGVSTTLSSTDENVTLDIRWTVLCDLFLLLIADSVYDSRSRVLLESVALKLGLGWLDVVKFEKRVTDALEIQEGVEKMEQQDIIAGRMKAAKKKRYMMLGLATLGGGLVIGLSAGLLAPVIGAGLGAAFTTIGVTGTTSFFAGAGGAALITTSGALTGSGIAAKGMARRTRQVRTFELLPLHNNKRVNCIITVPGFMNGLRDDVRLPFSVLDPIVGDVFSVFWEPEMMEEAGNVIRVLTREILSQLSTTVLQATVMTTLMSALALPIVLTKLGYLIDNPWSNALDRAKAAGAVLADVLIQRHLGVRPIMLIGFSLGARAIFYALLELAKKKAFGVVQDVFLLGATLTAPTRAWLEVRGVVAGRFVNCYARNDWLLNYLFRATSGGLNTVAGLRPVQNVPGLENVDVTDKIAGHGSYREFMPLILDELGFPVSADYFDEPEDPDIVGDHVKEMKDKTRGWFSRKDDTPQQAAYVQRPPSSLNLPRKSSSSTSVEHDTDDLPEREEHSKEKRSLGEPPSRDSISSIPKRAGFDLKAIHELLEKEGKKQEYEHESPLEFPEAATPITPVIPTPAIPEPTSSFQNHTEAIPPSSTLLDNKESSFNSERSVTPTQDELTQTFTRSFSFKEVENDDLVSGSSRPSEPVSNEFLAPVSRSGFQPPLPTLAFGSPDSAVWDTPADRASTSRASNFDIRSTLDDSYSGSTFNTSSSTAFSNVSSPSSSKPDDPFSSPTTISFGSTDGTISVGDPWGTTSSSSATKKLSYTTDPWK